jgi:SAM-dependent methyltransferase
MGNTPDKTSGSEFDRFAGDYASLHQQNIAISGEEPAYFADYKLHCIERLVGSSYREPVLDFGCGIGMLTERLSHRFVEVHGYDPSSESLNIARGRSASTFHEQESLIPDNHFGLVILANVLHHVAPNDRDALVRRVASKLRKDSGRLVVFEHNPINPLTRYVVSRCEFDADAVLLWPWQLSRLLALNGFTSVRTKFIVFFPSFLASLRGLEPYLGWLPLGAQMMVVGELENQRSR